MVQSILVVGGGSAGWITANLLNAHIRRAGRPTTVTLVESPDIPTIAQSSPQNKLMGLAGRARESRPRAILRRHNFALPPPCAMGEPGCGKGRKGPKNPCDQPFTALVIWLRR